MARTRPRTLTTLTTLAAGALGSAVLALGLGAAAWAATRTGRPIAVQDLVSVTVAALGAITAAWLAASCALGWVCLAGRLVGTQWRAGEVALRRCAPVVVRRAVAGAVGASLGLGLVATGAHAATVDPVAVAATAPAAWAPTLATSQAAATSSSSGDTGSDGTAVTSSGTRVRDAGVAPVSATLAAPDPAAPELTWQVTTPARPPADAPQDGRGRPGRGSTTVEPVRATDDGATAPGTAQSPERSASGHVGDAERDGPPSAVGNGPGWGAVGTEDASGAGDAAVERVVVAPGDSLWSIAAAHLPENATAAEIADAWPRWYEANRATIGADPDVLGVGVTLEVPAEAAR